MADTSEQPVDFISAGLTVRGTLHAPAPGHAAGVGIAFLHGWSGSRIGPHRMFVHAARRFTTMGCHCLRFDFRGRGDSDGATADASIRTMIEDTHAATDFLSHAAQLDTLLYLGICSGGKVAIGTAADHPRVHQLMLWSAEAMGPLRNETSDRKKTLHAIGQYARKLANAETWRKIARGDVRTGMVKKALLQHEGPDEAEIRDEARMLDRFRSFDGPILFIYGTHDPDTRNAADRYASFCRRSDIAVDFHAVEGANHSFYSRESEQEVLDRSERWLTQHILGDRDA